MEWKHTAGVVDGILERMSADRGSPPDGGEGNDGGETDSSTDHARVTRETLRVIVPGAGNSLLSEEMCKGKDNCWWVGGYLVWAS